MRGIPQLARPRMRGASNSTTLAVMHDGNTESHTSNPDDTPFRSRHSQPFIVARAASGSTPGEAPPRSPGIAGVLELFNEHGGVLRRADARCEFTAEQLEAAVAAGELREVRPYVLMAGAPTTAEATALALGGTVTCLSLLDDRGYWIPTSTSAHIRLPKHRYRNSALHACAPDATLHHLHGLNSSKSPETLTTVLRCAEECCQRDELVAVLESLERGNYTRQDLTDVAKSGGRKLRQALALVETGADSGVETLVRLRLRALGIKLRTQVKLLEWRVDLLVGEWLVVEVDGFSFHRERNEFVRDRQKDRALMDAGYHVRRFS